MGDMLIDLQELLKATARTTEFSLLVLSRLEQKIKNGGIPLSHLLKQNNKNGTREKTEIKV